MSCNLIINTLVFILIVSLSLTICQENDNDSNDGHDGHDLSEEFVLNHLKKQSELNETVINEDNVFVNQSEKTASKNITISWEEVDETFRKVIDEEKVLEKWQSMQSKLKSGENTEKYLFTLIKRHNLKFLYLNLSPFTYA